MNRQDQVVAAFSHAAETYEGAARAQAISADRLAFIAAALPRPAQCRVLEFGCGTGLLTRRLYPLIPGDWRVTDLSPAMLEQTRARVPGPTFALLDAEAPDVAANSFDLIVSNLAAQWFADLGQAVARLGTLLAPGGHLAFSTLGHESFAQWRRAHDELGLECGVPRFPDAGQLASVLPAGARIEEQRFALDYQDGRHFAAELKAIGAGTPVPGHRPLDIAAMRRLLAQVGEKPAMTYHVLHIIIGPR